MNITFIVNPHIWSPWDTRIGGSEASVVEWAKELHDRGNSVTVYHEGKHGDYNGVAYKGYDEFAAGDVNININYPQFPTPKPNVYATSLVDNPDTSQFDAVVAISQYAKDHTNLPERTVIVPLGIDSTHFYPQKKIAKQCLYASSPDRGLEVLLEAWPHVYAAHPDATLIVTYGAQVDMPGVMCLGDADEATMDELYRTSDIWCHPCTGIELYCITGKKAQAAGCIPVIIPAMALAETVARGFKTDRQGYADTLIEVLNMDMKHRDVIRKNIIEHANAPSWQESTDALEVVLNDVVLLYK